MNGKKKGQYISYRKLRREKQKAKNLNQVDSVKESDPKPSTGVALGDKSPADQNEMQTILRQDYLLERELRQKRFGFFVSERPEGPGRTKRMPISNYDACVRGLRSILQSGLSTFDPPLTELQQKLLQVDQQAEQAKEHADQRYNSGFESYSYNAALKLLIATEDLFFQVQMEKYLSHMIERVHVCNDHIKDIAESFGLSIPVFEEYIEVQKAYLNFVSSCWHLEEAAEFELDKDGLDIRGIVYGWAEDGHFGFYSMVKCYYDAFHNWTLLMRKLSVLDEF